MARELFAMQGRDYAQLQGELKAIEARLLAWHRDHALSRRLAQIPSVWPDHCERARHEDARPARVPLRPVLCSLARPDTKDHSTAGKTRLGKITRAGDETLRRLLVAGATAVIRQARLGRGSPSHWLLALLKRKPPKLAAVALANKVARIAWKLMVTGEGYDAARLSKASAVAA